MDLRDTGASAGTARLMLNMEDKAGVLRPRSCYRVLGISAPYNAQLHYVDRPGLSQTILAVGPKQGGQIKCSIYSTDGTQLDQQDLTTEPDNDLRSGWRCSFVDTFLRSTDGTPRPATLIVTPNATWVYEPLVSPSTVRLASVSSDATQINTSNIGYWASLPRGPIAVMHGERVVYAGFRDGVEVQFDSPIEDDATDVPDTLLAQNRASLRLSPGLLVLADEYDPIGIAAPSFFFIPNERITGLHSTGEVLLVFTDKGIWALSGYNISTYALQPIVRGVGCVSHWSIVTVGAVTYFAGEDGFYAFGGMGAPETVKLSEGLSPMWDGWDGCSDFLPDGMQDRLASFGWPWTVKTDMGGMISGRWNRMENRIWWSLPVTGPWRQWAIGMVAVFDIANGGWSLYFMNPLETTDGNFDFTLMSDAVEVSGRWVTSSSTTALLTPWSGGWDGLESSSTGAMGVPAFWLSQRLEPDDMSWRKVLDTRVKVLTRGLYETGYPGDSVGHPGASKDLPYFCLSGEAEAFDLYLDTGSDATYSQRGSTVTGPLSLLPHNGIPTINGVGAAPGFTLASSKWVPLDWFSSRCEGQVGAKSFRFGIVDDAWGNTRGPKVAVTAIEFDVLEEGTTHR